MGLSVTHLLVVLAIVIVVFGTKRLRNLGTDLGGAVALDARAVGQGHFGRFDHGHAHYQSLS